MAERNKHQNGDRVENVAATNNDHGRSGTVIQGGEFIEQVQYDGDDTPKPVLAHEVEKKP
jgi:hypothetical protein